MKKVFITVWMAVVIGLASQPCFSQSKALNKELKKEYKSKIKTLRENGWELVATSRTLEVALLKHYEKLNTSDENFEIVGTSEGKIVENMRRAALMAATAEYASRCGSQIEGKMKELIHNSNTNVSEDEVNKFASAYIASVSKKLDGFIATSYTVMRKEGGRSYLEMYLIVNEAEARKARKEAAEEARIQTNLENMNEMMETILKNPLTDDEK